MSESPSHVALNVGFSQGGGEILFSDPMMDYFFKVVGGPPTPYNTLRSIVWGKKTAVGKLLS
jgi:hypothetical protein